MNTYKVSFATPYDMDNIQREVILAESPEQVHSIFAGCHVIEVEERHAVELASALDIPDSDELERDVAHFGTQEPVSNLEMVDFTIEDAKDWQDQITELRGGL